MELGVWPRPASEATKDVGCAYGRSITIGGLVGR